MLHSINKNHTEPPINQLFSVGDVIRCYDYSPSVTPNKALYAQGNILSIERIPHLCYKILCQKCSFWGRENKILLIPVYLSSHDFKGRITLL